jgi:hypothetical protein
MKIGTFADDFTKDLESFVKNPIQIEPLSIWNPRKPASPERHMTLGKGSNIAFDTQIYMLEEQNHAFNTIESMLRIFVSAKQLQSLPAPDVVKEQVWLFAYKWFSAYYDLLTEPGVLHSSFYKKEHDRFLALLGAMLLVHPGKRASFIGALRTWYPVSNLLKISDDFSEFSDVPVESVVSDSPVVISVPPPSVPVTLVSPVESKKTRLVLVPPHAYEERNKTRKIYRS